MIAMSEELLVTGEAVGLWVHPAGFLPRAAGALLDWVAYGALCVALVLAVRDLGGGAGEALVRALTIVAAVLALVVAPTAVEVATGGRSAGRAAMGLRIVRADGGAIGPRHAFVRALTGLVEVYATFGSVAILVALVDPRSRRLGDFLAGTYSLQERVPVPPPAEHRMPEQLSSWAPVADVARLPDRLARRIGVFLAQQGRMTPASREALARDLLAESSPYVWPLPDAEASVALAGIAAVRHDREKARLARQRALLQRILPGTQYR